MDSCMRDNAFYVIIKQFGKPHEMLVLRCLACSYDSVNMNLHTSFSICFVCFIKLFLYQINGEEQLVFFKKLLIFLFNACFLFHLRFLEHITSACNYFFCFGVFLLLIPCFGTHHQNIL